MEGWHHCEGNMMKRSHPKPAGCSVAGQSCIPLVWLKHTKRLPCLVWRLQGDQVGFGITVVPLRVDISWSFFAEVEPIESIWWFCTRLKSRDLTKFLLLLDFCEISTCSKVRVPTNLTWMPGCQSCRTCTASLTLLDHSLHHGQSRHRGHASISSLDKP